MAWTTPSTRSAGALITDSIWNTDVILNLLALHGAIPDISDGNVRAGQLTAGDITVNNSTTLVNITNHSFTIAENEKWVMASLLPGNSNTTADFRFGLTFPSGCTGIHGVVQQNDTALTGPSGAAIASLVQGTGSTTADVFMLYFAAIAASSTAGTVQLQFAQWTANASNTIIRNNATFIAWRIA